MSSIIRATTTSGLQIAPDNSGSLQLQTNGTTTAVTIDTSQNVGIGTASPAYKLDVSGAIGAIFANPDVSGIVVQATTGTNAAAMKFNNTGGNFFVGKDSSDGTRISGTAYANCVWGETAYPTIFGTNNVERMRITSGGEVYIAGTTDRGAFNLQCNGTGVWGAGAYTNGSDERIKENITHLDTGLDVVAKLNPVTYTYKEDWSRDQSIQTGFIAQDLLVALEGKNYVDGIVNQSSEYMSVAYQNIIPILTKAIQEQQTIINDLKTRIETLEAK
jgi:hypothetical protein